MWLKFATNTQKQNTGFDFCTVNVFCKRNENKNLKNIRKASHRRCILILQHTRDKHILFVLFHTSKGVFSGWSASCIRLRKVRAYKMRPPLTSAVDEPSKEACSSVARERLTCQEQNAEPLSEDKLSLSPPLTLFSVPGDQHTREDFEARWKHRWVRRKMQNAVDGVRRFWLLSPFNSRAFKLLCQLV